MEAYWVDRRPAPRGGQPDWVVVSPSGLNTSKWATRKAAVADADRLNRYLGRVTGENHVTVTRMTRDR
jgi:hypothetical protein